MRCVKCGKRVRKKSSFCPKCGAKVPPALKKDKKKKVKKKRSKVKIVIPVFILLILAILSFLIFGGDRVPEQIRNIKGYSFLTGMVKDKLPDKLPFDLPKPPDVSIKLPFDLPDPGKLFGGGKPSDKLKEGKSNDEQKIAASDTDDSKNTTDAAVSKKNVTDSGVKDKAVLGDPVILNDVSSDWKQSNLKVIDHYTDLKAGTDTVVVYMKLENSYVNMTGTKEVTYKFNEKSKKWEAYSVSKLNCETIEPVKPVEPEQ